MQTLPEVLRDAGYDNVCVGFSGNPSSRGFDKYVDFPGWGSWPEGRSPKAQNLNEVALPELDRPAQQARIPFFLFLRHMDPHAPYLPPEPFERMFYQRERARPQEQLHGAGDGLQALPRLLRQLDAAGHHRQGLRHRAIRRRGRLHGCSDAEIFTALEAQGILDDTIVVINSDHGETLYDHDCFFDHHGLYDPTLHVPLIIRYPGRIPAGQRVAGYNRHQDLMPTILELAGIDSGIAFDGESLMPMVRGEVASHASEFYITECTWMRKHGWRTPEWKLIEALEPDFHFKPPVELYNLAEDPGRTPTWPKASRRSSSCCALA